MLPLLSDQLLSSTVEIVCYFCTAIGVALTILFAPRG